MASRVESGFEQDSNPADRDAVHGLAADLSRVLIVGNVQITRIVAARIVERSGLKPVCEAPTSAVRILPLMFPGLVILDGGPDNRDCDSVVAGLVALRRVGNGKRPAVILLSSRMGEPDGSSLASITDAVVTKPFTTEQLQPVVDRLVRGTQK